MALEFVKYMSNAEILKQQGDNSYKLAKEEYSLEVAVDKYLKIFHDFNK